MEIKNVNDIEKFLPVKNIERKVLPEILSWLDEKEMVVLLGARQVGKTTLIFQIINSILSKKNLTSNENIEIHYFNLDFPQDKRIAKNDNLINLATKNRVKKFIFIDEIQRLENSGLFLKYLYDMNLPIKIFVSGSSSLELKSKVSEALTGRKIIFNISPFNLSEIKDALIKSISDQEFLKASNLKKDYLKDLSQIFKKSLEIFTTYGSYPSVVLTSTEEKKLIRLKEIFNSYLEKDIRNFLEVKNENAFSNLVTILSASSGNILNSSEISNTLSIHHNTLDNYMFYLEKTFIIDRVRPFFKNVRKEIVKSPKIYFNDIGLRNLAINNFNNLEIREDKGFIFENFVYLVLKKKLGQDSKINFWRTKAGAEVDFIINKDLKHIPIEAKAKFFKKPAITTSMRSFINTYNPEKAFIVNLNLNEEIKINKCSIRFISSETFVESFDL